MDSQHVGVVTTLRRRKKESDVADKTGGTRRRGNQSARNSPDAPCWWLTKALIHLFLSSSRTNERISIRFEEAELLHSTNEMRVQMVKSKTTMLPKVLPSVEELITKLLERIQKYFHALIIQFKWKHTLKSTIPNSRQIWVLLRRTFRRTRPVTG